jgi:hypothetical protein
LKGFKEKNDTVISLITLTESERKKGWRKRRRRRRL